MLETFSAFLFFRMRNNKAEKRKMQSFQKPLSQTTLVGEKK